MKTLLYILALTILLAPGIWSASLQWSLPNGGTPSMTECEVRVSGSPITEANWDDAFVLGGDANRFRFYLSIKGVDSLGVLRLYPAVVRFGCDTTNPMRRDLNCDGSVDISDLVALIDYMFLGGPR